MNALHGAALDNVEMWIEPFDFCEFIFWVWFMMTT